MLGKVFGCKTVFEKHSDPFSHRKGLIRNIILSFYAGMEKFTIRRADLIIGTGAGLADQASRMGPKGEVTAIFDIPSSLVEATSEQTKTQRRELQQSAEETLLCFVGSFAVYQGIDLLFEAIPEVIKQHNKARFIIIGGSTDEIAQRKAKLVDAGIERNVSFLGKIPPDELPVYLKAVDILLAPRHSGVNTPLKILDYFKAAKPIVATDVASNRLILNETTAVFAPPTAEAYSNKILKLINDPDLCEKLGSNEYMLYKEKYNFHSFKDLLENAYATLN